MTFDGLVRQVAGCDDVRDRGPELALGFACLGEMDFEEAAVPAAQVDERVDGFDDAGTGCPSTADAGGKRHHGDFAALECRLATTDCRRRDRIGRQDQLRIVDIANVQVDG